MASPLSGLKVPPIPESERIGIDTDERTIPADDSAWRIECRAKLAKEFMLVILSRLSTEELFGGSDIAERAFELADQFIRNSA